MGCQPQNPWCHGNQNRPLYSLVSSFHRAINWNHPTSVFGPVAVLDGNRLGNKTHCVQGLLQSASNSRWSQGKNSDRNDGIERCRSQILSLAAALSWPVPNTNCRMSTNSPRTGSCRQRNVPGFYELRVYTAQPGKRDALAARFASRGD